MRPSLTRRFLGLYVATIVVVVGVAGGLAWVMMRRALHAGLDETLTTEATALTSRLDVEHGELDVENLTNVPSNSEAGGSLVQVLDGRGRLLFTSAALAYDRTLIERISTAAPTHSPLWFNAPLPPDSGMFRVLGMYSVIAPEKESEDDPDEPAEPDGPAVGTWVLVARPFAPIDQTLSQLAWVLASSVGAALLVAVAGGLVVARRGTQPVRALADRVGRVKAEHPELDLDRVQIPIELEPIVSTIDRLLERVRGELSRQRQLTADVAHDLRTPLAGVRALLDVCVSRERSTTEYVETISQALAALRQTSTMLDNVLTLSRLDADAEKPQFQLVDVAEILNNAMEAVAPLATKRNISLRRGAGAGQGGETAAEMRIETDSVFLVKILVNLLSNAIEHSPVGGTVEIVNRIQNGHVEINVGDRGPGVQPELRDRIFERFFRTDAARATGSGHSGLGLPISRGLARLLGGDVRLDHSGESGSVFTITLPR